MSKSPLIDRLANRLFGRPLVQNSFRGELVEEMVAMALEPEWQLCGGDWASCDLIRPADGLRIQVKQSAARQSWHQDGAPHPRPTFSIAHKTGRWEGARWVEERSRNAELFIFAWHPVDGDRADHREPAQWLFYVMAEPNLPDRASLSLTTLSKLTRPVGIGELAERTRAVAVKPLQAR